MLGMKTKIPRPSRDEYFMGIALAVRRRANCTGTHVGAILVLEKRIIATGYNGTPENMPNCTDGGCHRCNHTEKYKTGSGYDLCICVHAEQNALLMAARFGISVAGSILYTTSQPCFGCTKELLQAGVYAVHFIHGWVPPEAAQQTEYMRIQTRFTGGMNRVEMDDPEEAIAIRSKRPPAIQRAMTSQSIDETGHTDISSN